MIFCSDLHIRQAIPRSRKDDFAGAMERKLRAILELAAQSPPLLVAGDMLDLDRCDQELEQWVISLFKEYGVEIICTPGQHELPSHSLKQYRRSSLRVLEAAGVVQVLTKEIGPVIIGVDGTDITDKPSHLKLEEGWAIWGCAWGEEPDESMWYPKRKNLLLWHRMVTADPLWPGQELARPRTLLNSYSQYQIIITGDNHQTIVSRMGGGGIGGGPERLLVNPGSMMRTKAGQEDHRPCVFRYDDGNLEQIFLPIEEDVLDLTKLEAEKDRDTRFEAFAERLETPAELGLEFEHNLAMHFDANPTRQLVVDMAWRMVGK